MSLINKMLRDLEARQLPSAGHAPARPVYEDLRSADTRPPRGRLLSPVLGITLLVLFAAGLGVLGRRLIPGHHAVVAASAPVPAPVALPAPPTHAAAPRVGVRSALMRRATGLRSDALRSPPVRMPRRVSVVKDRHVSRHRSVAPIVVSRVAVAVPPQSVGSGAQPVDGSMVRKTEIPLTTREIAENAYRQGEELLAQGRRTEARSALRSALHDDPRNAQARELLAGLLIEEGRSADASRLLQQGLSVLPRQSAFIYLLSRIDVARGSDAQAVALLNRGLPDAGSNPDYLALLAALDQRMGKNTAAAAIYGRAVALRPLNGGWWIGLGISLETGKHWAAARQAYSRAMLTPLNATLRDYAEERLDAIRSR